MQSDSITSGKVLELREGRRREGREEGGKGGGKGEEKGWREGHVPSL